MANYQPFTRSQVEAMFRAAKDADPPPALEDEEGHYYREGFLDALQLIWAGDGVPASEFAATNAYLAHMIPQLTDES